MSADAPAGSGNFIVTLLKHGAPAMATATSELTDELADPTPMRALRRISRIAGPIDTAHRDGLLLRAARYIAVIPLAYRLFAVPATFAVFLAQRGGAGGVPVGLVALASFALNVYGLRWLLRSAPFDPDGAARLLVADLVITVVSPLVLAVTVPQAAYIDAISVFNKHLYGEVGLLTVAVGLPSGVAIALLSLAIALLAGRLNGGRFGVMELLISGQALVCMLLAAAGVLVLIGLGTRLALAYGIRSGKLAERARQHRMLHDTVLQTLEAIGLSGRGEAVERLEEVQRLARAQAMELRYAIESASSDRAEAGALPLGEKLAALAAEMARDGLRTHLVIAELDDDTLSEVRQIAIRDAVREALRNTMKHAGTDRVVVRVEEQDRGIAVIIRDHGTGFSPDDRPPGFGISESITARLAESGGTALVESSPGHGTRVTLWIPF